MVAAAATVDRRDEILALLEDGPKRTRELAGWISWKGCRRLNALASEGLIESVSPPLTTWGERLWALPSAVAPKPSGCVMVERHRQPHRHRDPGEPTQAARVLAAIRDGAWTSLSIAGVTGLSAASCSAILSALHTNGVVVRTGEDRRSSHGRVTFVYQIADRQTVDAARAPKCAKQEVRIERSPDVKPSTTVRQTLQQPLPGQAFPSVRVIDGVEYDVVFDGRGELMTGETPAGLGASLSSGTFKSDR